jgi:hypothetical protein
LPRLLKDHLLPLSNGVNLKYNPVAATGAGYARASQNMDCFDEYLALSKVPGSSAVTDNAGGAVKSLHQFEYSDRAGTRNRKQLVLTSAGVLKVRAGSSTLTALGSGFHASAACALSLRDHIYISGENQRGFDTGGKKYDGTNLRNWGVLAPGQKTVLLDHINDSALWGPHTNSTVGESSVSVSGSGSVSLAKTGTTSKISGIVGPTMAARDFTVNDGQMYVYMYLPDGVLQKLNNDPTNVYPAFEIELFDGVTYLRYILDDAGSLVPGWNLISFVVGSPTVDLGANETAVTRVRMFLCTRNDSDTFSGVLFNFLHQKVNSAPTAIDSGIVGNVDGTVSYRVTFLTEKGVESNAGSASSSLTVSDKKVRLISIPVSDDPQVIARRIYRDIGGDAIFRFVAQIDNNDDTEYTDDVASASLGGATAPIAGDDELDASPPARFRHVAAHNGRVFGIDADDPRTLWVSDVNAPEEYRLIDQISVDEELVSLRSHTFGLMLIGRDKWFVLTGDGVATAFDALELNKELGTNAFRTTDSGKSFVWAMREREIYLVADPRDPWYISSTFQDWLDEISDPTACFLLHDRARRRLLIFNGTNEVGVWQFGVRDTGTISADGSGIDPQDMRQGSFHTLLLPSSVVPACAEVVETDAETPETWIGCGDGRVYRLNDPAQTDWATDSSTEPVAAEWESHALPLGPDGAWSGRGEPRYLELEAETAAAATWTATVTILTAAEGAELASVAFDIDLPAGDSSVIVPVPAESLVSGGWARVKLANSLTGEGATLRAVRLAFVPRARRWGVRGA